MDEDFHPSGPLAEKRRKYFEARDKYLAEKKGFRLINMDTRPKGPQFMMVLLCVLGSALVSFRAFGPKLFVYESAVVSDVFTEQSSGSEAFLGVRIDPETVKPRLTRLENALFSPDQADSIESVINHVVFEVDGMAKALKESQDHRQEQAATELEDLRRDALKEGARAEDLKTFIDGWLKIRSTHFQFASWFRKPSGDSDTKMSVVIYRDVAYALLSHLGEGLEETESLLPEISKAGTLEINKAFREELLKRWQATATSWSSDLKRLQERIPKRPKTPPSRSALAAIQQLDSAMQASQNKLPSDRLPTGADLKGLEDALLLAQLAADSLSGLN